MGVKGLWQLLQSTGHPANLESLEGLILAVDVSIWLNQAVKGMRDRDGGLVHNAHLITLFNRVCKLLYYRIKPVFVFDGGVPELKRHTLAARRQKKDQAVTTSEHMYKKIVENLIKSHAVNKALGQKSGQKPSTSQQAEIDSLDPFCLPPIPQNTGDNDNVAEEEEVNISWEERMNRRDLLYNDFQDPEDIDLESEDFKSLPPDIQHEILTDIKATRKKSSWGDVQDMPQSSDEFSNYQLDRLMKHSRLSQKLDSVKKEIQRQFTGDVADSLALEGGTVQSQKVASDDTSHYLLITGLSKARNLQSNMPTVVDKALEDVYTSETKEKIEIDHGDSEKLNTRQIDSVFIENDSDKEPDTKPTDRMVESDTENANETMEIAVASNASRNDVEIDNAVTISSDEEDCEKIIETVVKNDLPSDQTQPPVPIENMNDSIVKSPVSLDEKITAATDFTKSVSLVVTNQSEHPSTTTKEESDSEDSDFEDVPEYGVSLEAAEEDRNDNKSIDLTMDVEEELKEKPIVSNLGRNFVVIMDESTNAIPAKDQTKDNEFKDMSQAELRDVVDNLTVETEQLQSERGQQQRMAASITDQMTIEAQELLRLFGLPYVVSPGEAEAQCAQLDQAGLTQGSITDDSDIWLFGGKCVYRHFFNQDKYVQCYKLQDIAAQLLLTREKLACMALFCGSDYTEGIEGAGPVTAIEAIAEFSGTDGLVNLKTWWDEAQKQKMPPVESKLRRKLRNLHFKEGFPNLNVIKAYMEPTVDHSQESFSWNLPDLDLLRELAQDKFGWTKNKTDDILLPVMKKLTEKQHQRSIQSYFSSDMGVIGNQKVKSKRVKRVLTRLKADGDSSPSKSTSKKSRQTKPPRGDKCSGHLTTIAGKVDLSSHSSSSESDNGAQSEKTDSEVTKKTVVTFSCKGRNRGRGRGKTKARGRVARQQPLKTITMSSSSDSE